MFSVLNRLRCPRIRRWNWCTRMMCLLCIGFPRFRRDLGSLGKNLAKWIVLCVKMLHISPRRNKNQEATLLLVMPRWEFREQKRPISTRLWYTGNGDKSSFCSLTRNTLNFAEQHGNTNSALFREILCIPRQKVQFLPVRSIAPIARGFETL